MTYYVFIARDEEEFSRYPSFRDGYHEKASGFLKSVRYIEEDGYCVLILPHEAKNVDADGNVDVRRMCTNVAAAINGIGHKYNDADKICILVHLGGEGSEGIDKWEQDLNVKLKDIKDASMSDNREKWSIKLLSSTRKDIIDITAGTITIPERADLERLAGGKWIFDIKRFVRFLKRLKSRDESVSLYVEEIFVNGRAETEHTPPSASSFIPLILCRNKESLRGSGVISPREYIVDLSVFEKRVCSITDDGLAKVNDNLEKCIVFILYFFRLGNCVGQKYDNETSYYDKINNKITILGRKCKECEDIREKLFEWFFEGVFLSGFCNAIDNTSANDGKTFIDRLTEKILGLSGDDKKVLSDIFSSGMEICKKEILQRLEFLKPASLAEYKAWFVPLFRRYCFQDEYAHGGSHCLELPRVGDFGGLYERENPATKRDKKIKALIDCQHVNDNGFGEFVEKDDTKEAHWFKARFGKDSSETRDPYSKYQEFLESLFEDELDALKAKYNKICGAKPDARCGAWRDFKATMAVCLSELVTSPEVGLPLGYMFPTKKINVLVVDDKGEDTITELKGEGGFPDIFTFYPLTISIGDALSEGDTIVNYAIEKIRAEVESGRSYEVVLLDLSLGEDPGYDLMGYHIVYRIKQFMPQAKVVVYSKLDDMGHIVRALGNGASWYLRKYNKSKLPRHIYSMFRLLEWKKEWRTVWSNRLCDFSFENAEDNRSFISAFDGKRKYLTYKCLEKYPGVKITVKPMNDGLSRAVTFKAVKGLLVDGDPVQTPVIVKIDTAHATRLEYERYFRFIRPYIANESGRVENPEIVLDDSNAAIVYTYAGKQDPYHDLDMMKAMFVRDI